jgi:hypothetical protein
MTCCRTPPIYESRAWGAAARPGDPHDRTVAAAPRPQRWVRLWYLFTKKEWARQHRTYEHDLAIVPCADRVNRGAGGSLDRRADMRGVGRLLRRHRAGSEDPGSLWPRACGSSQPSDNRLAALGHLGHALNVATEPREVRR